MLTPDTKAAQAENPVALPSRAAPSAPEPEAEQSPASPPPAASSPAPEDTTKVSQEPADPIAEPLDEVVESKQSDQDEPRRTSLDPEGSERDGSETTTATKVQGEALRTESAPKDVDGLSEKKAEDEQHDGAGDIPDEE